MQLFPESLSSFLIQVSIFLAIFLILLFSLNGLLFQPILRIIEKRKKATEGTKEEVTELQIKANALHQETEARIAEAKVKASLLRDKIKKEGEEIAHQILSETKEKSSHFLKEIRTHLSSEEKESRLKIKDEVELIAQKMTKTILLTGL